MILFNLTFGVENSINVSLELDVSTQTVLESW